MKLFKNLALALLASLFTLSTLAATVEIEGVKLTDSIELHGSKLSLNGAGTRHKLTAKIYVAGLYVGKKSHTPQEVISQPGPKRLMLTMLRGIDSRELGNMFTRGMENNMDKSEMSKVIPGLIRMGDLFGAQKPMIAGDTIMLDWLPDVGTVVTVKGVVQGAPFKEPEFFKALMLIWLGQQPADAKLKESLLAGGL